MLTVVIHVLGFGLVRQKAVGAIETGIYHHRQTILFAVVLGGTTLLATALHAIEAGLWAVAYLFLNAFSDARSLMLYSLNATTNYGHVHLRLDDHCHLMGAMEALNGWLLLGLTTAFLFALIEQFGLRVNRGNIASPELWTAYTITGEKSPLRK
jgi:hypothetical protein